VIGSRWLPAGSRIATPWLNGGGATAEILANPPGATIDRFDWRASIATIEAESDFSTFVGIDRFLMPLSPAGLSLSCAGTTEHIPQFATHEFAGETAVRAIDVTEQSLDLNLMIRRGIARGMLGSQRVDDRLTLIADHGETVLVVILEGTFTPEAPGAATGAAGVATLEPMDAFEVGGQSTLVGTGTVAIARIQMI
jgi:environmental stress-induced protein Ves